MKSFSRLGREVRTKRRGQDSLDSPRTPVICNLLARFVPLELKLGTDLELGSIRVSQITERQNRHALQDSKCHMTRQQPNCVHSFSDVYAFYRSAALRSLQTHSFHFRRNVTYQGAWVSLQNKVAWRYFCQFFRPASGC